MKTINLRDYYPSLYPSDFFIEVPDEVADVFIKSKRNEAAYNRRKYYNKAQYSLDRTGIDRHVLYSEPSAEEIYDCVSATTRLLSAIGALPNRQARRIYAYYIFGVSKTAIAKADGITERAVNISIQKGLWRLKKILKNTL